MPPAKPSSSKTPEASQPKKRGRPFGWKPGMGPYSVMNRLSEGGHVFPARPKKPAPGTVPKRKGRPLKPGNGPPRLIYEQLRPSYVSFLCEWAGCPAELQNLETLRRHVLVVHGEDDTCRWAQCAHAASPKHLPTRRGFRDHVESDHLAPFAWHTGDGPRNTSSEADMSRSPDPLPAYLFDDKGNQITPSALHQELEDEEERKARRKRLRRILLQRDRNAPEEEEEEEAEADEVG